jgi:hypothetical protein
MKKHNKDFITKTNGIWSGTGTSTDPFQITDQSDLEAISDGLAANNGYEGKYFRIENNIELNSSWAGIGTPKIGSAVTNSPYITGGIGFAGTLYGTANTTTVTVNRSESDKNGVGGIINYLAPKGTLKQLTVAGNVTVAYNQEPNCDNDVDGISAIGGVVGYNCGVIDHVISEVKVSCTGQVFDVGGIAGFNDNFYTTGAIGVIRNCENSGNVTAYEKVGGIVGENAGLVASCSNAGQIEPISTRRSGAGGIAGRNGNNNTAVETGNIWCCNNTGDIFSGEEGTSKEKLKTQSSWLGGIAGFQNSDSAIFNSYNNGKLRGYGYAGYMVGSSTNTGTETAPDYRVTRGYYGSGSDGASTGEQAGYNGDAASTDISVLLGELNTDTTVDQNPDPDTGIRGETLGEWNGAEDATPMLKYDADAYNTPAAGWTHEEKNIYLDPTNGNDANSGESATAAKKTLNAAIKAAGIGNVYVMGTVTIDESVTLYDSTTFLRYDPTNFTDPMFIIDAPNNSYGVAYVTFEGAVVDGGGVGTLFQVNRGRLRLRGSSILQNADIGVDINGQGSNQAQAELNEVLIDSTVTLSVRVNGATVGNGRGSSDTNNLILDSFGTYEIKLKGVVALKAGAYITAEWKISCNMTVECEDWNVTNRKLIVGVPKSADDKDDGYDLDATDMSYVHYVGNAVTWALNTNTTGNEIVISATRIYYLDGTKSSNGTGTAASPFNSLTAALNQAGDNDTLILVTGMATLSAGTYSKVVTIQRGSGYSGILFNVNAASGTMALSGMTILGRYVCTPEGIGTIVNVTSGTLTLDGGVTLTDCNTAAYLAGGNLRITQAVVHANRYSVYLTTSNGNLVLNPETGTAIDGAVYLPNGKWIVVRAALTAVTGEIQVTSEQTVSNTIVASCTDASMAAASASKLIINGTAGRASSNTIVIN